MRAARLRAEDFPPLCYLEIFLNTEYTRTMQNVNIYLEKNLNTGKTKPGQEAAALPAGVRFYYNLSVRMGTEKCSYLSAS